MILRRAQWDRVTFISVLIVAVVAFVVIRVLTGGGFTADQKTMVIQGALTALAVLTGFWLNGTPEGIKPKIPGSTESTTLSLPGADGKAPSVTSSTSVNPAAESEAKPT